MPKREKTGWYVFFIGRHRSGDFSQDHPWTNQPCSCKFPFFRNQESVCTTVWTPSGIAQEPHWWKNKQLKCSPVIQIGFFWKPQHFKWNSKIVIVHNLENCPIQINQLARNRHDLCGNNCETCSIGKEGLIAFLPLGSRSYLAAVRGCKRPGVYTEEAVDTSPGFTRASRGNKVALKC